MKTLFLSIAFLLLVSPLISQSVSINTSGSPADASAILDITSNSKGLLIPRMDSTSRMAIASPAKGLIVMDTSYNVLYRFNGKVWSRYFSSQVQGLTISGGSVNWDYERGDYALLILTGDITLSIQNPVPGMAGILEVKQDGTGNRKITFPTGSTTSGGNMSSLVLSSAPNAVDVLSFVYNGQQYRWYIKNNF